MLLYLLETLLEIILVVGIFTEIIVPSITGGKFFPIFRRKDLSTELAAVEEDIERAKERLHIDFLKRQAEVLKHQPQKDTNESE